MVNGWQFRGHMMTIHSILDGFSHLHSQAKGGEIGSATPRQEHHGRTASRHAYGNELDAVHAALEQSKLVFNKNNVTNDNDNNDTNSITQSTSLTPQQRAARATAATQLMHVFLQIDPSLLPLGQVAGGVSPGTNHESTSTCWLLTVTG